jgi:hypothetical protein
MKLITAHTRRNKQNLQLVKRNWGKQAFSYHVAHGVGWKKASYHAAKDWNSVPIDIRDTEQFTTFKNKLIIYHYKTLYRSRL